MPASRDPSRLPLKRADETEQEFLDRCNSDPMMMTEYPNISERAAICMNQAGMKPKVGGDAGIDVAGERPPEIRLSGAVTIHQD